jgi:hypothetical protein
MPVSKLPSFAVAECEVGPELLHVTVSPTFTVIAAGENWKSLIVTVVEAAARARGSSTGSSSRMACGLDGSDGAGAGSAGGASAGAGGGSAGGGAGSAGAGAGSTGSSTTGSGVTGSWAAAGSSTGRASSEAESGAATRSAASSA